eukprot:7346807-Lingulodinium_polyedra.AAC.1
MARWGPPGREAARAGQAPRGLRRAPPGGPRPDAPCAARPPRRRRWRARSQAPWRRQGRAGGT